MGGNGPLLVSRLLTQIGKQDNPMAIHLQDIAPMLISVLVTLIVDIGLTIPALPCSDWSANHFEFSHPLQTNNIKAIGNIIS